MRHASVQSTEEDHRLEIELSDEMSPVSVQLMERMVLGLEIELSDEMRHASVQSTEEDHRLEIELSDEMSPVSGQLMKMMVW